MNPLKKAIEENAEGVSQYADPVMRTMVGNATLTAQHHLLDVLVEEIEGMGFVDTKQAGQFSMHADGYNQALDDVITLLKEAKE